VAKKEWNFKKVFKKCKLGKNCQAKERPTNFETIKLEKKTTRSNSNGKKRRKKQQKQQTHILLSAVAGIGQ
jgi:hypothetical protein